MSLAIDVTVAGRVQVRTTASAARVLAVVGPNGAGKTTLLRALAGVEEASGSATLAGRDLLALQPEQRRVGWVPQAGALFPHLTVRDNLAYGLRSRGLRRTRARAEVTEWLERFDLGALAGVRPPQLSGGQAQRVALARALAARPDLLLLDEPLAALDAGTREKVRRLLREALTAAGVPVLLVTHDPVDVVTLADDLLVLENGRVTQEGPVQDVLDAPASTWVAGLMGLNAWRGEVEGARLEVSGGGSVVLADAALRPGPALALVSPAAVSLHRAPPTGSARNVLAGEVVSLSTLSGRVRVTVASTPPVVAEVTPTSAAELALADGGRVWASFKANEVRVVGV